VQHGCVMGAVAQLMKGLMLVALLKVPSMVNIHCAGHADLVHVCHGRSLHTSTALLQLTYSPCQSMEPMTGLNGLTSTSL
jgi:hypothetical protein